MATNLNDTYTVSNSSSTARWNPVSGCWEQTLATNYPASGYTTYFTSPQYVPTGYPFPLAKELPTQIPLFADAATIRATLQKQLDILNDLSDGLEGEVAETISDAIYFLKESIDALDKIGK